ncbi:hypothetical protein WDW37_06840 [Bdellovibrionota bacterium FG-1]
MIQIVVGCTLIGIGAWGVVDEWYYLKDLISGAVPVGMIIFGLMAVWVAILGEEPKAQNDRQK